MYKKSNESYKSNESKFDHYDLFGPFELTLKIHL